MTLLNYYDHHTTAPRSVAVPDALIKCSIIRTLKRYKNEYLPDITIRATLKLDFLPIIQFADDANKKITRYDDFNHLSALAS